MHALAYSGVTANGRPTSLRGHGAGRIKNASPCQARRLCVKGGNGGFPLALPPSWESGAITGNEIRIEGTLLPDRDVRPVTLVEHLHLEYALLPLSRDKMLR